MFKRKKLASALTFLSAGLLFASAAFAINNDIIESETTTQITSDIETLIEERNPINTYDSLLTLQTEVKEEEKEMPSITEETHYKYLEVIPHTLNIRNTPGLEQPPVGVYKKEDLVIAHSKTSNGWYKLSSGKYINGKYVKELNIVHYEDFMILKDGRAARKAAAKKAAQERRALEEAKAKAQQAEKAKKVQQQTAPKTEVKSVGTTGTAAYAKIQMSSNEYELLAKLIKAEAGGETFEGQVAVAKVVFNRVLSGKFPNSVYDVIFAKNQFVPAGNGTIHQKVAGKNQYDAIEVALNSSDNLNGATYFYAPGVVRSAWHESLKTVAVIGAHHFKVN